MKPCLGLERERRGNAGLWKTRKTKTRFPFVSPNPWKSLHDSHIPTAPTSVRSHQKPTKGTQQPTSTGFHSFRPLLRLENTLPKRIPRRKCATKHLKFRHSIPSPLIRAGTTMQGKLKIILPHQVTFWGSALSFM